MKCNNFDILKPICDIFDLSSAHACRVNKFLDISQLFVSIAPWCGIMQNSFIARGYIEIDSMTIYDYKFKLEFVMMFSGILSFMYHLSIITQNTVYPNVRIFANWVRLVHQQVVDLKNLWRNISTEGT